MKHTLHAIFLLNTIIIVHSLQIALKCKINKPKQSVPFLLVNINNVISLFIMECHDWIKIHKKIALAGTGKSVRMLVIK